MLVVAAVALAGCGGDDGSDGFAAGRACRNVERLIAAVNAGDESRTDDELDRLLDIDGVDEQVDVDDVEGAIDDADDPDDDVDETTARIEDAVDGLDCDLDIDPAPDPPATDPTTDTTSDPTSAPTDPTTDTTTDPTSAPTGSGPPFTLPPAPTAPTTPTAPTSAPGTDVSDPTSPPATTDETATTQQEPPSELIAVDVDATDDGDLGGQAELTIAEYVDELGLSGSMAPADRQVIESIYVGHDFGEAPRRYESITYRFTSDLSDDEVLQRFRDTVSELGDYEITDEQSPDGVAFRTTPADYTDQIPNWEVRVFAKEAGVHRVEIVRSDYRDDVGTEMRNLVAEASGASLDTIDELGWDVTGFTYSSSDATATGAASIGLNFGAGDDLDEARDRLVDELDADDVEERDDGYSIVVGDEYWSLHDAGSDGVNGTYNRY